MPEVQEISMSDGRDLSSLLDAIQDKLGDRFDHLPSIRDISNELKNFGLQNVVNVLRDILRKPKLLSEIAKRSYLHGNGFYKIIIHDCKEFRLRLHIWRAGTYAEENLHNHRWSFGSTILTGTLYSELWDDAANDAGIKYKEYRYYGISNTNQVLHVPSGETFVALKEVLTQKPGDAYYMPPEKLHRIIGINEQLTSTLMCQTKITREFSRTIIIKDHIPTGEHLPLKEEELRKLITEYIQNVEKTK